MLFYRVSAQLKLNNSDISRAEERETENIISSKSQIYFEEKGFDFHIAVSNICYKTGGLSLCVASKSGDFNEELLHKYLSEIDLVIAEYRANEITLKAFNKMLVMSERAGFNVRDNGIAERLGINNLTNRHETMINFEKVIENRYTKSQTLKGLESNLCSDDFKEEIERIYKGTKKPSVQGHPVHYIVNYDDVETEGEILKYLIDALQSNNRVISRRYAVTDIGNCDEFFEGITESRADELYKSAVGATIVITFGFKEEPCSSNSQIITSSIINITNTMKKYRNKVLTVFCLSNRFEKVKAIINENLGDITAINLSQGNAFNQKAKDYLKIKAKNHCIQSGKELLSKIKKDTAYSATNLNEIFDSWYDRVLKENVYSQYKEFETASKNTLAKKMKGWAIKELDSMIGLNKAKHTIHSAIDFYKAQKVFKSKGFIAERPSMHMVFTGNPGTAKTTVARLFAQIMKDNGLLSVGDLHEVGRADLVGKYVGWTAKIVKEKFQAAKGSVLFIDEAYSLVEKGGLYGDEAINTIVQEMENNRDNMIVIFAGYPKEMERFMEKNPGLKSRIAFHIPFDDYNTDELLEITNFIANKNQITLDKSVNKKLAPIFEKAVNTEAFGNGRFVRNMFEKAIMKQSSRLIAMDFDEVTKSDVTTLVAEDFEMPIGLNEKCERKIGF